MLPNVDETNFVTLADAFELVSDDQTEKQTKQTKPAKQPKPRKPSVGRKRRVKPTELEQAINALAFTAACVAGEKWLLSEAESSLLANAAAEVLNEFDLPELGLYGKLANLAVAIGIVAMPRIITMDKTDDANIPAERPTSTG